MTVKFSCDILFIIAHQGGTHKKKNNPFPVAPDNFVQCWEYVDKHHRLARRQALIAKIGGFLINLLFLLSVIFFGCGLIHDRLEGSFCDFVETLFFFPFWQKISPVLLTPGAALTADIGKLLGAAYLISAIAFVLLAALIWLVYHPLKAKLPTGTYEENTALLAKNAHKCRDYSYKTRLSTSIVASVLVIIAGFVLFFGYVIYIEDAQLITSLLTRFPTADPTTNSILYVMVLYLFSNIISSVLLFITRPIYRYEFSYDLVVLAERGAIFARENNETLTQEELDEKNRETAVKIREEAIALEKDAAYAKAKTMFYEAAVRSDVPAMEHYARHCLLNRMNDSARYWLKQCVSHEEASKNAKKMLLRMQLGLRHNVRYLKHDEAPPTTAQKVKNILLISIKVIWRILIVSLLILSVLVCYTLFKASTDPEAYAKLPANLAELLDGFSTTPGGGETSQQEDIPTETVSPFQTPSMTLTAEGTNWSGNCVAYDENGEPVIFCYGKDLGGDLSIPLNLGENGTLFYAGIYTGNIWDVRHMGNAVSYLPQTRTAVVSEEYLKTLEPGEYFIVLNDFCYIPLLVTDETTYNSTQRGLAACGNDIGWIKNDLLNPQDITLTFYNLGDNTIRSLTEVRPLAMVMNYPETVMDAQYYTISPDGRSVTINTAYWQMQEVGSYVTFKVRLANGEYLDMGYINVGTVEGDYTGLMEITGNQYYSVSAGGDYTAQYRFAEGGSLLSICVYADSYPDIIVDDNLSDLISDYIDFESGTITLPADVLMPCLTPGEFFHIGISYTTSHGQNADAQFSVQVAW